LKNDFQRSTTPGSADKLKTILELFVSSHREISEEAFHSLLERDPMGGQLITVGVVFEISGLKALPVYQSRASES
jgi:hypothetical protein